VNRDLEAFGESSDMLNGFQSSRGFWVSMGLFDPSDSPDSLIAYGKEDISPPIHDLKKS
jgi:hypothetical protein